MLGYNLSMCELREWIIENCIVGAGRFSPQSKNICIKKDKLEEVLDKTSFLSEDVPFSSRLGCILLKLKEAPKCKICKTELSLKVAGSVTGDFKVSKDYCSSKCSRADPEASEKRKQTLLKKYGVENISQIKEVKEKKKVTLLENYGVDNPQKAREIQEKTKQTNIAKYGVSSPAKSQEVKEKTRQTNIERHGTDWVTQSDSFKVKASETKLAKYGYEHASQAAEIKNKTRETNLEKYGKPTKLQLHLSDEAIKAKEDLNTLKELNKTLSCVEIAEKLGYSKCHISKVFRQNKEPIKIHSESSDEKEVKEYIKSLDIVFESNRRSLVPPRELDIYIPSKGVAVEYNGLYWHSELQGRKQGYHLEKTQLCKEKGIQLLQIFSNEWVLKKEIVKSILANKLGKTKNVIYARSCEIKEVPNIEAEEFLDKNHIQGAKKSSVRLGLYKDDKLVSLMTLSKRQKNYDWELDRFCNSLHTLVVGGASKLLKYFRRNYQGSILTYCDLRYSDGSFYEKLGFKLARTSKPNYWYTRDYITLESRQKYQKHKLKKILESYSPSITEWQNMQANGYDRIWDCGNFVFELT